MRNFLFVLATVITGASISLGAFADCTSDIKALASRYQDFYDSQTSDKCKEYLNQNNANRDSWGWKASHGRHCINTSVGEAIKKDKAAFCSGSCHDEAPIANACALDEGLSAFVRLVNSL